MVLIAKLSSDPITLVVDKNETLRALFSRPGTARVLNTEASDTETLMDLIKRDFGGEIGGDDNGFGKVMIDGVDAVNLDSMVKVNSQVFIIPNVASGS